MRYFYLVLVVLFVSGSVSGQGIVFEELTLAQAVEKAKAENKLVFVDMYTAWCTPCKLMDKEVYPMKEMGDYFNPKFVSVKYDAERSEEGRYVNEKYGVKAYPTYIILDGNGELLHMFAGGTVGLGFIDKMEESFNPSIAFGDLQKRYNAGDRDKVLVANYIKSLQGTFTVDVSKMAEAFADSLWGEELVFEEALYLFDDFARMGSKRSDYLFDNLELFCDRIGREKIDVVLKKKFEAYYASILGRQMVPNEADIAKRNNLIDELGLSNAESLEIYKSAVSSYISKEGVDNVYEAINRHAAGLEKNDLARVLYFTVPALGDLWSDEQVANLVNLVKDERTKDTIAKAVERARKK